MEIASLITGPVGVNTYIVYGKNKGECIVIDPSDTELVNKKLNQLDVKPTAVLLTHGHFDHIVSVADIQRQYNARVYIHEIDEPGLRDPKVNLCDMAHIAIPPCHADVKLKGGETVHESGFDIKVISTPGHTKGSLSYAIEDNGRKVLFRPSSLPFCIVTAISAQASLPLMVISSFAKNSRSSSAISAVYSALLL